jgi:hypothetical protein
VRDKTFSEDLQQARTGNQPNAYAAIRNLVTGAFRRAGYANIAHARRYYARDDQRILALYGYCCAPDTGSAPASAVSVLFRSRGASSPARYSRNPAAAPCG